MKKTNILLTTIIISLPFSVSANFKDIEWNPHKKAIEILATTKINPNDENFIISWHKDGTFRPNNPVTFAETLAITMKSWDKANMIEKANFWEHWSAPLIRLYNSEDKQEERIYGNHNKDTAIKRDFALYLILRQAGIKEDGFMELYWKKYYDYSRMFADVSSESLFANYIRFAEYAWYTRWYGNWKFWVNDNITRWELSTFVYNILIKDGWTQKVKEKYIEFKTIKWLELANRKFLNIDEVKSDLEKNFWLNNPISISILKMLETKEYNLKFKVINKDWDKQVTWWCLWWSRDNCTELHWYTNDDMEEIMEVRYLANIRWQVDSLRKQWASDKEILEIFKKSLEKNRMNEKTFNRLKYYLETWRTDFRD